ncbi:MAG: deoxynucleoside kinase [Acidimicrobiia bacterium]|nr:deoxynucleoside kinase [Acidimicrobiia bacterium]
MSSPRTKAYYAAALFNEGEREFNLRVKTMLDECGFETWFPQEDAGFLEDYMDEGMTLDQARHHIFEQNLEAVRNSDVLIFNLDGRVPDEGACIEAGVAFGMGKRLIGIQTDFRAVEPGGNNLMIDGVLNYEIAADIEQLRSKLTESDISVDLRSELPRIDISANQSAYVAVTGPLGAGKTTLLEVLNQQGGWQQLEEPNDENPYLSEVYASPEDLAFRMQVYYLAKRAQQHQQLPALGGRIAQERSILDDGEVFFPAYHRVGAYGESDLQTLMDMYRGLLPGLKLPDRIVAVDAPFELCMERIGARSRDGEQHLDEALARSIYDGYREWWDTLGADVIWIDSGSLDLVDSPEDRAQAVRTVHDALEVSTSAEVLS